jgi:tetratricopeptide (TPR) repeat protein
MKKIAVLLIFSLLTISMVNAQKREVTRANRQLSRGNLNVALDHIKNAVNDPTTMNDPQTWLTQSKIYLEIARSENPEHQSLAVNPLDKSFDALKKAQELDVNNKNLLAINQALLVLSEAFFNEGAIKYNEANYSRASESFLRSYQVSAVFGSTDTATLYNAGLSAEIAGLLDKAYDIYVQVDELNYDQPFLYSSLANISLRNKDFEGAASWINKGRQRYPENLDLIFAEANVYLTSGNIPEARRVLQIAIERDPDNANLHYAFAVNYDQMSKDSVFSPADRDFAYTEAIKSYKRAIELKPDYFDAIYNLGALYFNEGIKFFVEADQILRKGYTNENLRKASQLEEKSKKIWREDAQVFLEEAFNLLQPNDENYEIVLRSLRELYMRTGQSDKLEATNEIWQRFSDPNGN